MVANGTPGSASAPPDPLEPDADPERWALFIDVDGTLLALRDHPDSVRLEPGLGDLLDSLSELTNGALALVSGRRLRDLDRIFSPLRLPAAGLHGMERRRGDGRLVRSEAAPALVDARTAMTAFATRHDGLFLEDKGRSLALHYRRAPEFAEEVQRLVISLAETSEDRLKAVHGKMVMELKPAFPNKGSAISEFLAEPPFLERLPVFLGDDVTDEDGFETVNRHNGVSIRVGEGPSLARYRLPDEPAVAEWLRRLQRALKERRHASR